MTDKKNGLIASMVKCFLSIISLIYGFFIKIMRFVRILGSKKLPCKVISVGNITLGGTGKTPFSCMIAKLLKNDNKNPCVLIRGYGNDEWKMLSMLLGDIPLIVGKKRYAAGIKACAEQNQDTIVLDDGFQHWPLKRDLDIVLIDSTNPFGNRKLFPRGILRERVKDLKRADIIVLTKADMAGENLSLLKNELNRIFPDKPVLESMHVPSEIYCLDDKKALGLDILKGKKIGALAAIVNTDYFEHVLKNLGASIDAGFYYPDHYDYKERDLKSISNKCSKLNIGTIVTTEKDACKLDKIQHTLHGIQILVLHIDLKVTDGERILCERIHSLYTS